MNLSQYWARDYSGRPFRLFGPAHLAGLAVVLALNLGWAWLGPGLGEGQRQAVRLALAGVLLLSEGVWHVWNLATGQWRAREHLPFHLCSFLVYLTIFMLLTRNYAAYAFCYFLGVGGASQALLTPEAGRYGFPHIRFWVTMVSHGVIVTAPLYMTVVEGYRPTPAALAAVAVQFLAFAAVVALVNRLLGSNFLYIARKPDTPSLMDYLGPWPWYLGWLLLLAAAVVGLLYVPFLFL